MTVAPFAAAIDTLNQSVSMTLANASATLPGVSEPVPVLFDLLYDAPFDGQIDSGSPVCHGLESALGNLQRGSSLTIDAASYTVERVEPDGAGWVRLMLARKDDHAGT